MLIKIPTSLLIQARINIIKIVCTYKILSLPFIGTIIFRVKYGVLIGLYYIYIVRYDIIYYTICMTCCIIMSALYRIYIKHMYALRRLLDICKIQFSDKVTQPTYILYMQIETYFSKLIIRLYLFISPILFNCRCTHNYVGINNKGISIYVPYWYW